MIRKKSNWKKSSEKSKNSIAFKGNNVLIFDTLLKYDIHSLQY